MVVSHSRSKRTAYLVMCLHFATAHMRRLRLCPQVQEAHKRRHQDILQKHLSAAEARCQKAHTVVHTEASAAARHEVRAAALLSCTSRNRSAVVTECLHLERSGAHVTLICPAAGLALFLPVTACFVLAESSLS